MSPVLRINAALFGPASDGQRRVTVVWQDGPIPWEAVSSFRYQVDEQDAEKIRWYLEDYAEYPADPAPASPWIPNTVWRRSGPTCSVTCSPVRTPRGSGHRPATG